MKQITDLDELAGKTIERFVYCEDDIDDVLALIFTDGTFVRIKAGRDWEGAELNWGSAPYRDDECIAIGLMTREEANQRQAEAERKRLAQDERRERETYDRLRAKFEGGET